MTDEATQPEPAKPQGWGEPWSSSGYDSTFAADGKLIGQADTDALCGRIVACVNALAGIANPDKLGELLNMADAACEAWETGEGDDDAVNYMDAAIVDLRKAIAAIGWPL